MGRRSLARTCTAIAICAVALATGAGRPACAEADDDERFLTGLRERRLYALAERYSHQRLARPDLAPQDRAAAAVELSRTLLEHALASTPDQRGSIFDQARQAVAAGGGADDSRGVLLAVQHALAQMAEGEALLHEAEVSAADDARRTAAQDRLRSAIRELRAADAAILEASQRRRTARGGPEELSESELHALAQNVRFQLARALEAQGRSYPQGSADRTDSLAQAVELLGPLERLPADDPLTWRSRGEQLRCLRLLQRHDELRGRAADYAQEALPADFALSMRAELARSALDEGRAEAALDVLRQGREIGGRASPDLDLAFLETYLEAWRAADAASRDDEAADWQQRSQAVIAEIDRRYGPYWRRRAESLLGQRVANARGTQNVDVLVRAAEGLYRAGQLDESLAAYDRASGQAADAGDAARSFDLAFTAAAIEQTRGAHDAAGKRFADLASRAPEQPRAAEAHLLSIYNTAERVRGGDDGASEVYARLLDEHVARWPTAPTAEQALVWQGQWRERQRDWPGAIAAYSAVDPRGAHAVEAVAAARRAADAWLDELQASSKPVTEAEQTAIRALERLASAHSPVGMTGAQRSAAVALARLLLRNPSSGAAQAEPWLRAALADRAETEPDDAHEAASLLVFALAAQGKADDAAAVVAGARQDSVDELLALVAGLDALVDEAPTDQARPIALLTLAIIEREANGSLELAENALRELSLVRVRALSAAGKTGEALDEARALAADSPNDGAVQEALARALFLARDGAALTAWQKIAERSKPGGARWLRAKLHEAQIYEQQGRPRAAAQLIRVVRGQYPSLGGQKLAAEFTATLGRCEARL